MWAWQWEGHSCLFLNVCSSPSDGSEDPHTTPFLEIADQKGNPLKIPPTEKKVEFEIGRSVEVGTRGRCCVTSVCVYVCAGSDPGHGLP